VDLKQRRTLMTTPEAATNYLAAHNKEWRDKKYAVWNPRSVPQNTLPVIYGFNNGGAGRWWHGGLLAEDGSILGGHICSNESYMPYDLGCLEGSRPDRHEEFQKHYPGGYRMEFVGLADIHEHPVLPNLLRRLRNEEVDEKIADDVFKRIEKGS
jgi:hypothetical protein